MSRGSTRRIRESNRFVNARQKKFIKKGRERTIHPHSVQRTARAAVVHTRRAPKGPTNAAMNYWGGEQNSDARRAPSRSSLAPILTTTAERFKLFWTVLTVTPITTRGSIPQSAKCCQWSPEIGKIVRSNGSAKAERTMPERRVRKRRLTHPLYKSPQGIVRRSAFSHRQSDARDFLHESPRREMRDSRN